MTAPCKDCPDRHELCHSDCPRYREYRDKMDKIRAERFANSTVNTVRQESFKRWEAAKLRAQKKGRKA